MDTADLLVKFLLAIGFGLLTGLERDAWKIDGTTETGVTHSTGQEYPQLVTKSKKPVFFHMKIPARGFGGVRTYILLAILGSLCGISFQLGNQILLWVISITIALFLISSYILNYFDKNTFGLTTEISMIILYVSCVMLFASDFPIKYIIALVVINALVTSMKNEVHQWISHFSRQETTDIIRFILITMVLLLFLPNIDYSIADIPYLSEPFKHLGFLDLAKTLNILNPYKIWLVVVFISSVNFLGYFFNKLLGSKYGLNLTGFMGGLVSSTAVTQTFASQSKHITNKEVQDTLISATMLANTTSFLRVFVITLALNWSLAIEILFPMSVLTIYLLIWSIPKKVKPNKGHKKLDEININFRSPFEIGTAIKFGIMFLFVALFTKLALYFAGNSGFIVSTILSAFSGMEALTINTAQIVGSQVTVQLGVIALVGASAVNLFTKIVYIIIDSDNYFKKKTSFILGGGVILSILLIIFCMFR